MCNADLPEMRYSTTQNTHAGSAMQISSCLMAGDWVLGEGICTKFRHQKLKRRQFSRA